MAYLRWLAGLLLVGAFCAAVMADEQAQAQRKRLIEQKLRLVEMLVASPAARAPTGPDGAALVEKGRQLLEQARNALAAGELDQAATSLDEALRSATKASSRNAAQGSLSESALRQSYKDLAEQVATYRAALLEVPGQPAKEVLARVDAAAAEGQRLHTENRLSEANKKVAEANRLAVEGLSRLRAGQEVVLSLKFATPAEEYAYEQKRFRSSEIIADMLIGEGRAEGEKRKMVDTYLGDARGTRGEAENHAQAGRHKEAVASMEKASQQINRALQLMGVPMF